MNIEVRTPSGKDISGIIELTTTIVVLLIMGYFAYLFLDSKGKENKEALVRRNAGVVTVVDAYGHVVPVKEFCVNGVIYFGSPMTPLRDRDDKVVPCVWQELVITEKEKK